MKNVNERGTKRGIFLTVWWPTEEDGIMRDQPKTDPALLERLSRAAKHEMTAEEIRRQRLSFVYGNLPQDSTLTRNQVAAALARMEGE